MNNSPRPFLIRPTTPADSAWVAEWTITQWGAIFIVAHGTIYHPAQLPAFVAIQADQPVGLLTYHIAAQSCEVVTLDSLQPSSGIGSALIATVKAYAQAQNCHRLWLITTNDNLNALGFYQKRGFHLAALHRDAMTLSRRLKPQIPLIGNHGIPLRDELELEILLSDP